MCYIAFGIIQCALQRAMACQVSDCSGLQTISSLTSNSNELPQYLLLKDRWLSCYSSLSSFVAGCHISSSALSLARLATGFCAAGQWTASSSDSILYCNQASGRKESHEETLLQSKQ